MRIWVESTNVESIEYSDESQVLRVRFRNGYEYEYVGVSAQVYNDFVVAESKGKFVHRHLKDRYPYRRTK